MEEQSQMGVPQWNRMDAFQAVSVSRMIANRRSEDVKWGHYIVYRHSADTVQSAGSVCCGSRSGRGNGKVEITGAGSGSSCVGCTSHCTLYHTDL